MSFLSFLNPWAEASPGPASDSSAHSHPGTAALSSLASSSTPSRNGPDPGSRLEWAMPTTVPTRGYKAFADKMNRREAYPLLRRIREYVEQGLARDHFRADHLAELYRFMEDMNSEIARHPLWADACEDELENAYDGLEKFLASKLYGKLFAVDRRRLRSQEDFDRKLIALSWVRPDHLDIFIPDQWRRATPTPAPKPLSVSPSMDTYPQTVESESGPPASVCGQSPSLPFVPRPGVQRSAPPSPALSGPATAMPTAAANLPLPPPTAPVAHPDSPELDTAAMNLEAVVLRAGRELDRMCDAKAPRDKLDCILRCCQTLMNWLRQVNHFLDHQQRRRPQQQPQQLQREQIDMNPAVTSCKAAPAPAEEAQAQRQACGRPDPYPPGEQYPDGEPWGQHGHGQTAAAGVDESDLSEDGEAHDGGREEMSEEPGPPDADDTDTAAGQAIPAAANGCSPGSPASPEAARAQSDPPTIAGCPVILTPSSPPSTNGLAHVRRPSADDFLPVLIWMILRSRPHLLVANLDYIASVRLPARLTGEPQYFFTHLQSAVSFVRSCDYLCLSGIPSQVEFNRLSAEALRGAGLDVPDSLLADLPEPPGSAAASSTASAISADHPSSVGSRSQSRSNSSSDSEELRARSPNRDGLGEAPSPQPPRPAPARPAVATSADSPEAGPSAAVASEASPADAGAGDEQAGSLTNPELRRRASRAGLSPATLGRQEAAAFRQMIWEIDPQRELSFLGVQNVAGLLVADLPQLLREYQRMAGLIQRMQSRLNAAGFRPAWAHRPQQP